MEMGTGMDKQRMLSVVSAALNEEEGIGEFIATVLGVADSCSAQWAWEVIIVDDGSTDATAAIVRKWRERDSRVSLLKLAHNFGQEAAMLAGLVHSRGDAVVVMDADLQDPPELILKMLEKFEQGHEVIHGKYERVGEGLFKKWSADLYYWLLRRLMGRRHVLPAHVTNFRMVSRRVVDAFTGSPERDRFGRGLFSWVSINPTEITFRRSAREHGKTKYGVFKLIDVAWTGITSLTTRPLRWVLYLGILFAFLAVAAIGYIVWSIIVGAAVPGWASLMGSVLTFGSVQLIALGIIGEYVGKVLIEAKRRPMYVVQEFLKSNSHPDK